ncbi:MAG: hypothetical protein BWX61_01290 [Bacteroidetes bacterium ADurb.Bin035]|nr:MAG: hypothetical protein BWX61_01290 [Bacteroidetes bacterium ADurb.Bin035]
MSPKETCLQAYAYIFSAFSQSHSCRHTFDVFQHFISVMNAIHKGASGNSKLSSTIFTQIILYTILQTISNHMTAIAIWTKYTSRHCFELLIIDYIFAFIYQFIIQIVVVFACAFFGKGKDINLFFKNIFHNYLYFLQIYEYLL